MVSSDRWRKGRIGAYLGIGVNVLLSALKITAGTLASSHALIADGLHSLADVVGSAVLLVVMRVAHQPSDADHPYGHGKAEPVGAKLIGIIVILAGFQVAMMSIDRLRSGEYPVPGVLAVWIAIISIVVKGIMFRYKQRLGESMNSPAVLASAQEHQADAYSSVAVLIAVSLARLGWPFLDPVAGVVVALYIIKMGWNITRRAVDELMDRMTDPQLLQQIRQLASCVAGVEGVDDVRLRSMGPEWWVDLKIEVNPLITVLEGHDVALRVRSHLTREIPSIVGVMIHVNPAIVSEESSL